MSNYYLCQTITRVKLAFGPLKWQTGLWPIQAFIHDKTASGPFILLFRLDWPLAHSFGMANIVHQSNQWTYKTYIGVSNLDNNIFQISLLRYYSQWSVSWFALELDPTHTMNTKGSQTINSILNFTFSSLGFILIPLIHLQCLMHT